MVEQVEKVVSDRSNKKDGESEGLRITSSLNDDRILVKVRQHEFSVGWPGSEIAPCPGEYMLGALAACSSGVASIVAKQMNFDLRGMTFDMNGFGQSSKKLTATVRLTTTESEERIQQLKKTTDRVCPVHQFFKSTGVKMEINWERA